MSTASAPVSDMLVTVKSREVQRGLLADMRGDRPAAIRHFLAAAHLELVLADDYAQAGLTDLSVRSRLSAASCLWRAGRREQARAQFEELLRDYPDKGGVISNTEQELERDYPAPPP